MLDNKSLVSSANYLTDLNNMYSKSIVLNKSNVLIPNGINHTIEATISYFDKLESIDKVLTLKAPVVINSNASMLAELANIVSEISTQIDDAIILNSSAINGSDLVLDISVSTDLTILKTLNIKVKYGNILKYDLDSISNEYIQILTNAGLINNEIFAAIIDVSNQVIPNIDELLLVYDKANEVSINTDLVSTIKSEVISMKDETIVNRDNSALSAASALASKNSAFQKASEALISANNADVSESNALASELLAEKWASENENVIVAEGKYSAKHYALKSQYFSQISDSSIDDANASSIHTYSSNKIENDLNVVGFDLTANVAVGAGQIAWNSTEGTYDMGLENGSVLQAGQENIRKVTNNSGALIQDGRLVMYNGTNGASGRINVKPFTAGFNEAIKLYGVATQSIANGADGIITVEGKARGIDTTGASVGEVWEDNDILYAKPNDNGMMTKIEPADNELKIVVASVIKAHNTNGTLEIRFMPFNENAYYTKAQNDILLDTKLNKNSPLTGATGTKITYDSKGLVTSSGSLSASDVPSLDASKITSGTIDPARLPAYVDDVLEFANLASFPALGQTGKIYVSLDTNKTYRWSGSTYVYITSGAVDSVAGKTGVVTLIKSDVGLENVNNTSDATKPISILMQAALNLKAPLASPELTGTPTAPTASTGTSTTQLATTQFVNTTNIGDGTTSFNGFGGSGFKNYVINGRFDVWQSGDSINIAGGEVRCTDMFIAYSTATTPTASRDIGLTGFYNSLKISGANSVSNKYIIHRIEAVNVISLGVGGNTKITFSLWLKADVNSTVKVGIRVPNTSDTWSSYTTPKISNEIQITTSWDRYSVTFDLDFVYWGGIALYVYTTTAQTSLWTTGWQLEQGSVATPFENLSYALQYEQCRRYYRRYATQQNVNDLAYKMRTTPTASGTAPYTYSAEM